MNLRLHHPDGAAQLAAGADRLLDAETWNASRRRDSVLAQNLLGLVLVNLHRCWGLSWLLEDHKTDRAM
jgi:hypothetical protein